MYPDPLVFVLLLLVGCVAFVFGLIYLICRVIGGVGRGLFRLLLGELNQFLEILDDLFLNVPGLPAGVALFDPLLCRSHLLNGSFERVFVRFVLTRFAAQQFLEQVEIENGTGLTKR